MDYGDAKLVESKITKVCSTLELIASNYPSGSIEAEALGEAALAYSFLCQHRSLLKNFRLLLDAYHGELSEELKASMRERGIDPDDLSDEIESQDE